MSSISRRLPRTDPAHLDAEVPRCHGEMSWRSGRALPPQDNCRQPRRATPANQLRCGSCRSKHPTRGSSGGGASSADTSGRRDRQSDGRRGGPDQPSPRLRRSAEASAAAEVRRQATRPCQAGPAGERRTRARNSRTRDTRRTRAVHSPSCPGFRISHMEEVPFDLGRADRLSFGGDCLPTWRRTSNGHARTLRSAPQPGPDDLCIRWTTVVAKRAA
jgi:hypothetical protein